ncbi:hypothetical protein R5R35_008308 [Gryllus longicercus]|uniref:Uncharacterized protein n=1 Tax=Gryllus longicercus TaxID=2509291 RepID=A0AAN9ZCC3_9ORTH
MRTERPSLPRAGLAPRRPHPRPLRQPSRPQRWPRPYLDGSRGCSRCRALQQGLRTYNIYPERLEIRKYFVYFRMYKCHDLFIFIVVHIFNETPKRSAFLLETNNRLPIVGE